MKIFTPLFIFLIAASSAFSQGYFLNFKLIEEEKDRGTISFYSQNDNCRMEMDITGTSFSEMKIVNILPANNSKFLYQIDEKTKRCTKNDISNDADWKDYAKEDYKITVLESEKVNGYNTQHVIVSRKDLAPLELWTTTDIANYAELVNIKTMFTGKPNLYAALKDANAYGFPVKVKTSETTPRGEEYIMQIILLKVETKDIPPAMFQTDGYSTFATVKNMKPTDIFLKMMGIDPGNYPEE